MAMALSLGTLVTLCRQRAARDAGTGGDETLDVTEWKSLIAEYYGELHALIVEKGAGYFFTEATITATGAATYALPSDHLTTLGVDRFLSGSSGARVPVYGPIAIQERTRLMGLTGNAVRFGFEGTSIGLYPVPSSGSYRHLYVPQPTDYSASADSTSVDVINIYGRKFIIWGVASVAQHKGSESQERAMVEFKRATDQLEYWACQRALTQPSYRVPEDDLSLTGRYVDVADYRITPPL